ncbi:ADP-ribosyltransferase [Mycobacterium avium]|uniref:ADP-ribosyltransferase n=1 Tax=Mycobacterium avium TaxID=1764 RepID=UPI0002F4F769|nr:ADP-ribosyltransferase [Mycobacterium avium]
MAPLACDPTALDHAGATVVAAGESLGSVISTLTAALAGTSGMAGDDPVGAALGRRYDGAAAKLIQAMADTRNGLCSIGDGVRMSAHNYAVAEAMSDLAGRASALPAPQVTGPLTVGAPPSAVGHGSGAPAGWGWVAPSIGMIWPTGDSAKLRAAAAAWATAGANFMAAETAAGGGTMAAIGAQQIPEGAAINKALADASSATADVARQCQTIAAQLNSYAAKVDQVHAAILDLLSRICDPLTGIKEVWDLLTDEDEDEIKKIADDIRTVVDNFGREAETLGGQIEATVSAVAAATENMSHWAGKEWDHFLHGTPVGRALNQVGQAFKGVGEEGWGFLKGLYEVSPNRMLLDPVGYGKTMAGMVEGAGTLVGLGSDGVPGAFDAWKALGKDVTHWDEWGSNPAEALGKSTFDVATLALPGGPLSKLGKFGHTAADALKGLKKPPGVPKPPEVKPPAAPKAPDSGQPAPSGKPGPVAPSGKPAPEPADGPLPHSPTESKPPAGGTPPAAEPPKPTAAPHAGEPKPIATPPESVGKPVTPAPAEGAPAQPHEPVSARVPPTVPAADTPAPSAPAASMSAASGPPMPPTPSLPEPASLPSGPSGDLPAETPPTAGIPHSGEPSAPSSVPPHFPDTPTHGLGDGGAHAPGDGGAHGPPESDPKNANGHGPHDASLDSGSDHHLPLHPLDSDDLAALAHYTGPGYQELNFALREGALDASQQARVDALQKALEKLPVYEGAVVRGTNLPADVLEQYRPGEVITEAAFTSTSTDHTVAQSSAFAGNTEFRIWSTTGRDVSSVSMYPDEKEILFPAGSKFYVASKTVDPQTGRTIIEMIER